MMPFYWTCPFCRRDTTITDTYHEWHADDANLPAKTSGIRVKHLFVACPNQVCREFSYEVFLYERLPEREYKLIKHWQLIPEGTAKVFPDHIPKAILDDYREACLIKQLSPKASATLSRRCLQGMIHDFWKIRKKNLKLEIDALKGKIDKRHWDAIDALRHVGNIGAHMEKDVNLVIDVEPHEAAKLIGLIEVLLKDWYIGRHEREENLAAIVELKDAKKTAKHKQLEVESATSAEDAHRKNM